MWMLILRPDRINQGRQRHNVSCYSRGSREQKVEKLRRLRMAGVTQFNIYLENGDEEKLIADYAERILPEVRCSE